MRKRIEIEFLLYIMYSISWFEISEKLWKTYSGSVRRDYRIHRGCQHSDVGVETIIGCGPI